MSDQTQYTREERVRMAVGAVIDRWYRNQMLRFSTHDDGSDDLLLRDEIVRAVVAAEQEVPA